ncbi:hypothetical protein [Bacillus mycoides]|uniref:hypothetical protein n=1 Tax=Bacillus mycoides TaxID=1405 RepID=UPI0011A7D0AA|nr:hypothetical protein [Bacillus mycoides]
MNNSEELQNLIRRLKCEEEGVYDYFSFLLETERVQHQAAIGSIKYALNNEIKALSDEQLRAIAIDILKNDAFFAECDVCTDEIDFADMEVALDETRGKHPDCYSKFEELMDDAE